MKLHLRATGRHLSVWNHTVLPATRHKWTHPTLTPARGRYSIYLPRRDGRLSWPRWPVTYRDCLPAHRRSPIQLLTGWELSTADHKSDALTTVSGGAFNSTQSNPRVKLSWVELLVKLHSTSLTLFSEKYDRETDYQTHWRRQDFVRGGARN